MYLIRLLVFCRFSTERAVISECGISYALLYRAVAKLEALKLDQRMQLERA
jgi:hypothetical protein